MLDKTEKKEKRRFMTFSDRVRLHTAIANNIHPKDANGFISYQAGWDDERIAKMFGVNISSVRRFRQQEFGELRQVGATGLQPLWDEVKKLRERVSVLEDLLK